MKLNKLAKGLSATSTAVFAFVLGLTIFSQDWTGLINTTLGVENTEIVDPDAGKDSSIYFKSEFGDGKFTVANQALMLEAAKQHNYNEVAEGSILFKNNGALPFTSGERKISIFGNNSANFCYFASNGGEGNKIDLNNCYTFEGVFADAGFEINPVLMNAYKNSGISRTYPSADSTLAIGEAPKTVYTPEVENSFNEYNDAAIILITREYGEGNDAQMVGSAGKSELAMNQNELDMIDYVRKSSKFDKVVVLLNTTYTVELDWCEEDWVDAVLCVGFPGQWGAKAIPDLLTGVVNPSGRTPDTWATNSLSAPACVNEGTETPQYTNVSKIRETVKDDEKFLSYMSVMVENIYVGYKYYETRYEDAVLDRFGAKNPIGAIEGSTSWDYAKEMVYPFGLGYSYTTFDEEITGFTNSDGKIVLDVKVTNTGSVAGKHSVEVYANTPYGDYEKANKVEKAAVNVVAFDKTDILEPGASETLHIDIERYLLASYDEENAKGYIISEGDYYLGIGDSCHDALNNILAKKGATGMVDELGRSVTGNTKKAYKWTEEFSSEEFKNSLVTGNRVTNRFDDCDLNYFYDTPVATYISRSDWANTYPKGQTTCAATDEMIRLLKGYLYTMPDDAPTMKGKMIGDMSKGITLIKLRGVAFDDPLWDEYLSQWTVEDLAAFVAEGYGTKPMPKYGVPKATMIDGPLGLTAKLPNNKESCTTFACEPILAGTLNKDIIYRRGQMMGEHCIWTKTQSVNGPGCNLHRTPFNGRNGIYFSEDGNLTYLVAVHEALGYRNKGASAGAKHFVLNDQEFVRQGVSTFFTEQSLRETSLRAFESVLTGDNSYACMMAFNRVGCVAMNNSHAPKDVTREEWGFKGFLQSDASVMYSKDRLTIIESGLDLFTADGSGQSTKAIIAQINDKDDGYMYEVLLLAVKHAQFNVVNSNVMNNIGENSIVIVHTPWWVKGEIGLCIGFGVISLASIALMLLTNLGVIGKKEKEEGK